MNPIDLRLILFIDLGHEGDQDLPQDLGELLELEVLEFFDLVGIVGTDLIEGVED